MSPLVKKKYNKNMKTGVISLSMEQHKHKRLDIINRANAGFITVREALEQVSCGINYCDEE